MQLERLVAGIGAAVVVVMMLLPGRGVPDVVTGNDWLDHDDRGGSSYDAASLAASSVIGEPLRVEAMEVANSKPATLGTSGGSTQGPEGPRSMVHTMLDRSERGGGPPSDLAEEVERFDWPVAEALSVAFCESAWRASTVSLTGDYGYFGINAVHAGRVAGDLSRLLDPATNVRVANALYVEQGRTWYDWRFSHGCHGLH